MTLTSGGFQLRDLPDGRLEIRYVLNDGCVFGRTILTVAQRQQITGAPCPH